VNIEVKYKKDVQDLLHHPNSNSKRNRENKTVISEKRQSLIEDEMKSTLTH
jgi:hypothetical protein